MGELSSKLLLIAIILIIIGGLNWLWVGITANNLVSTLINATFRNQTLERALYIIIGIAALYVLINIGKLWKAFP